MKKTIKLLPVALIGLALSFTACNNESRSELNGGETTLELSSSIGQNRVTTQSDQKTNHWDGNEQIGVYSTSLTASNVLYTAKTAGASTDFTTQAPITIPYGTEQHDIKAYYPYDAAATTAVEFDLTKQNSQPLLYATGTATNANPKLNLNFGHKLGKLRIKVVTTNALKPTESVSKVTVNEVLTRGSLNIESGDFTVDNTAKGNLDLKAQGEEFYTYLMPGESIQGKVIAIEQGGKVYKATLANDKTVEAGKYYRYTISLSNVSAKIEDGSGTIDNEDEGDTGEVIGAPEEGTTPVTATLTSTSSEYASGTLSAPVEGGSYIFTLAGLEAGTQVSAKADPAADWLTFSGDVALRAAADQTFTVKVEANETTEKRETTITLTAEGMNDLTFAVQQAAKEVTPEPEPEPEPGQAKPLFPGADFEDWDAFTSNLNKFGLKNYATQADGGRTGKAMLIKETPKGNDYVFTTVAQADGPTSGKTITFYIKGTSGKSLSLNVYTSDGQYQKFNLGTVEGTSDINLDAVANNQYTGTIDTKGEWVKVTLNISGLDLSTSGNFFALKVGKEVAYDLMIDDFTIE